LLRKDLNVFQAGGQPGYGDEAFRRLALRRPDRELPLARLRQEHVVIAQAGEELRLLLEKAVNGEVTRRSSIELAAATYLVYYVNHIAVEEEEDVLPLAAKELTPADWAAVRDAAPEQHEPPFGDATKPRFREFAQESWLQAAEHRRPGSSAGADVPALGAQVAAVLADRDDLDVIFMAGHGTSTTSLVVSLRCAGKTILGCRLSILTCSKPAPTSARLWPRPCEDALNGPSDRLD
jgi:hypothetical protein